MKARLKKIRHALWRIRENIRPRIFFVRRRLRVLKRYVRPETPPRVYILAMTLINRTKYAELAIANINSLHFINHHHRFVLYCDDRCAVYMRAHLRSIDYPSQIEIRQVYGAGNQTWQWCKVETTLDASGYGAVHVDADSIWYDDLVLDPNRITFQTTVGTIGSQPDVTHVVRDVLKHPEWTSFTYYTCAFIGIPARFMNEDVKHAARTFLQILLHHPYDFLETQEQRNEQKRLSEQLAMNLALHTNYPESCFTTLAQGAGHAPGNTMVKPLYYGCANRIIE